LTKVHEISSYTGLYKNSKGEVFDLRPRDTCPCYETLKVKSILDLCEMLVTALRNQSTELEKTERCDPELLSQLKKELSRAEKNYEAQKARK